MNRHVLPQIPYQLARTPLAMLDASLGRRLPAGAVPRRAVTLLLGTLDSVAGRLIDGSPVAPPSSDRPEQVHAMPRAAAGTVVVQAAARRTRPATAGAAVTARDRLTQAATRTKGSTATAAAKQSAEPTVRAAAKPAAKTPGQSPVKTAARTAAARTVRAAVPPPAKPNVPAMPSAAAKPSAAGRPQTTP